VAGVLVDGASQSHNFGPLNLLTRTLKKPQEGGLATIQFFPHICHLPFPLPSLHRPFHSLPSSFIINDIISYFSSYPVLLLVIFSPSQSQANVVCDTCPYIRSWSSSPSSSMTQANYETYVPGLLFSSRLCLFLINDSFQYGPNLSVSCSVSSPTTPEPSSPSSHHHPSFYDVHLPPLPSRSHPYCCLSCHSSARGRHRGHLVISCSPGNVLLIIA